MKDAAPQVTGQCLPRSERSADVLIAIVIGAALGALAATRAPPRVPAAVLISLAAVLACSLPVARSDR